MMAGISQSRLLENHLAPSPLMAAVRIFPLHGRKGIGRVGRAEDLVDRESHGADLGRLMAGMLGRRGSSFGSFSFEIIHD